jgi:hypothetical protein
MAVMFSFSLQSIFQVEAGLGPGQRYFRSVVDGSGLSVEIVVCERIAGSPDYAVRIKVLTHLKIRLTLMSYSLVHFSCHMQCRL